MANNEQIRVFIDTSRVCFTCLNRETCYAANEMRAFCEYYRPAVRRMDEVRNSAKRKR